METLKIRNLTIGEGMPKLCVPLVGKTKKELLEELRLLKQKKVDLVEWRLDLFDKVEQEHEVEDMLHSIQKEIDGRVLLGTFRTIQEGGMRPFTDEQYRSLYHLLLQTEVVDLIDVELFRGEEIVSGLLQEAHAHKKKVILSNHDFQKTPTREEMLTRLQAMQRLGGDICKLAVMPQQKMDVLTLLSATLEMKEKFATCPLITMSMAKDGLLSRMCGEVVGSAITFASLKEASAPGQIPVEELAQVLSILHDHM